MTQVAVPSRPTLDLNHELIQGFVARLIRSKARRLIGHASLRPQDQDDIRQELSAAVWQAAPGFDPAVGDWESFVATVVERTAAQILISRRAEKRQRGHAAESLDVLVTDADGIQVPLATQVRRDHQSAITRSFPLDEHEQAELRLDLETLLAPLPESERAVLCELAEQSQSEVARGRGVARRTIRCVLERARERIANSEELSENRQKPTARSNANRKA